ncbi:fasciclin domain-containing protein [Tenacibaculum amylolyticum]|uniref:fasciclin domain-containing protein n=1 Tax=Tenacibaculum amylolyticum TaxID=104269 RepID=UPI003895ADDB
MLLRKFKTIFALSLFLISVTFISCDDNDTTDVPITNSSLTDRVAGTNNLTSLVSALQRADLITALEGEGPFTVFAPTNTAFQAVLDSNPNWNSLSDIPVNVLKNILMYHVVSAKALSSDLTEGQELTTLSGGMLTVDLRDGVQLKTTAGQTVSVVGPDLDVTNGVIHIIDEVLLPKTAVDDIPSLAIATPDLSSLVAALQRADLVTALQGDGPFTVFAPTNAAFQALLNAKAAWTTLDDIPVDVLKSVLQYHVVPASAFSIDLTDNQVLTTLSGGNITVDLSNGVKIETGSGQSVSVTTPDVAAFNGVVHIVDEVFLADALPKDITDVAIATSDLSILVAALQRANLVGALQTDGPFTVFAPTNAAFQALLDSNPAWNSLEDIPVDTLTSVLLFHVINGKVLSNDLSDTYVNTLATGPNSEPLSLQIEVTGGVEFNGDATPVTTNVDASNGVVHIIDKVMLPPNVVTLALNNAGFSTLVTALTDARHTTDFVSILSGDGPFTIFAPTNAAFQALLDSNAAWNSLADIPIATLDAVLKYHVISGANVQADQLMNGDVTTLGGTVTIDLTSGAQIQTSSMQTVNILIGPATNDVQGTNGVIHAIDTVLLP